MLTHADLLKDVPIGTEIEFRCVACGNRLALYVMKDRLVHAGDEKAFRPSERFPTVDDVRARRLEQLLGLRGGYRRKWRVSYDEVLGTVPKDELPAYDPLVPALDDRIREAQVIAHAVEELENPRTTRGNFTGAIHKVVRFGDSEKWIWRCRCGATPQRRVDRLGRLKVYEDKRGLFVLV